MNKIRWSWFFAAIPLIIIFKIAGFVDNFWMGLGIVSIGAGVAILQLIPVAKLNILSKIFLAWAVIVIIVPLTITAFQKKLPQHTKTAAEQRAVWGDMEAGERARVHGLQSLTTFHAWSDHMEAASAEYFQKKFKTLEEEYLAGRISSDQARTRDKELRSQMEDAIKWRKEASDFITQTQPKTEPGLYDKASEWINSQAGSLAGKLLLLGLAGVALLLAGKFLKAPRLVSVLGALFLGTALIIGAVSLFSPEIKELKGEVSKGTGAEASAPPAPVGTEFYLPAQTGPQGVYAGVEYRAGQRIRLVQNPAEFSQFTIVGRDTQERVTSSDYTTMATAGGGLWLRPEAGKPAKIKIFVQ